MACLNAFRCPHCALLFGVIDDYESIKSAAVMCPHGRQGVSPLCRLCAAHEVSIFSVYKV